MTACFITDTPGVTDRLARGGPIQEGRWDVVGRAVVAGSDEGRVEFVGEVAGADGADSDGADIAGGADGVEGAEGVAGA